MIGIVNQHVTHHGTAHPSHTGIHDKHHQPKRWAHNLQFSMARGRGGRDLKRCMYRFHDRFELAVVMLAGFPVNCCVQTRAHRQRLLGTCACVQVQICDCCSTTRLPSGRMSPDRKMPKRQWDPNAQSTVGRRASGGQLVKRVANGWSR